MNNNQKIYTAIIYTNKQNKISKRKKERKKENE